MKPVGWTVKHQILVGKILRSYLRENKQTVQQVADAACISRPIADRARVGHCSLTAAVKMCQGLGISLDEIITYKGKVTIE